MNKRIKELAEQAFEPIHAVSSEGVADRHAFEQAWLQLYTQKFAELIVRECANSCHNHDDIEGFGIHPVRVALVTQACSENIKRHFGVEP